MKALCNVCRKDVQDPWMIDGWKPVCKECFDAFRGQTKAKVKLIEKEDVAQADAVPVLSPDMEPFVILFPEDSMLMEGQPQPWRDLWNQSKMKNDLEREKAWPDDWAAVPEEPAPEEPPASEN